MRSAVVLVVDDHVATRRLIRTALVQEGYTVLEASDGRAAMDSVLQDQPDLILQDLFLPDLDGVDLLRQIRALPGGAELPILAYSGWISRMDQARLQGVEFNGYLVKPVDLSRLRETVRSHLSSRLDERREFAGRRVVIALEDPGDRLRLAHALERIGFEVTAVEDGVQALDAVRLIVPDVVVGDILMPHCDGYHLSQAIREDPTLAATPVILTFGDAAEGDPGRARSAGANALVPRSADLAELTDALRAALGLATADAPPKPSDDNRARGRTRSPAGPPRPRRPTRPRWRPPTGSAGELVEGDAASDRSRHPHKRPTDPAPATESRPVRKRRLTRGAE